MNYLNWSKQINETHGIINALTFILEIAVHIFFFVQYYAGKRLKEKFYKLFGVIMPMKDKLKRKKKEVMEKDAPSRRAAKIPTDDTSSNEGSICDSVRKNITNINQKTDSY